MDNYASTVIETVAEESPGLPYELASLYALLALTRGTDTTLEDVHDAWALWRQTTDKNHRSLIPFDELSEEVRELDRPYMEAIHRVAKRVGRA